MNNQDILEKASEIIDQHLARLQDELTEKDIVIPKFVLMWEIEKPFRGTGTSVVPIEMDITEIAHLTNNAIMPQLEEALSTTMARIAEQNNSRPELN